jgi:4-hydroxy-4-methyl-2-oxoglutarate aldolase
MIADLAARLAAIDVSCLCDADRSIRVLDPAIRPISPGLKMAGGAFTVSCRNDFLGVLEGLRAAKPGDVLVVDAGAARLAVAGELFATEAKRKGLNGLVVDGAVRDVATIRTLGFPVYARAIHPAAGTAAVLEQSQQPIQCGGVNILPGEVLIGDDDGIVVIALAKLRAMLPAAEAIQNAESDALARMAAGQSLFDITNFDEHLAALRAGRPSRFRFNTP